MQPLTKRQREILDYLRDFIQQQGYAPSLEEIGRRFGLSSLAGLRPILLTPGVRKFRSWDELLAAQDSRLASPSARP